MPDSLQPNASADQAHAEPADGVWTVACLCAAWCTTCGAYRTAFEAVAATWAPRRPGARFAWIDIEDDADALGDAALAIENFPTVLLMQGSQVRFHGTVLPHAATLDRLLQALADDRLAPGEAAAVSAQMAAAVAQLAPERRLR